MRMFSHFHKRASKLTRHHSNTFRLNVPAFPGLVVRLLGKNLFESGVIKIDVPSRGDGDLLKQRHLFIRNVLNVRNA